MALPRAGLPTSFARSQLAATRSLKSEAVIAGSFPTGKFRSNSGQNKEPPDLSFRKEHHTEPVRSGGQFRGDYRHNLRGTQVQGWPQAGFEPRAFLTRHWGYRNSFNQRFVVPIVNSWLLASRRPPGCIRSRRRPSPRRGEREGCPPGRNSHNTRSRNATSRRSCGSSGGPWQAASLSIAGGCLLLPCKP